MLKKLIKHECIALMRVYQVILIAISLLTAFVMIIGLLPEDNSFLRILRSFTTIFYGFFLIVMGLYGIMYPIFRFYKNFVTEEGYLTFTLPAKVSQLTATKIICGGSFAILTILSFLCSVFLYFVVWQSDKLEDIKNFFTASFSTSAIMTISGVIFILVVIFCQICFFYLCIALGQLSSGNKIIASVIFYFIVYGMVQIVMMAVIFPIIFGMGSDNFEKLLETTKGMTGMFLIGSAIFLTLGFISIRLINCVFTRKLNLE